MVPPLEESEEGDRASFSRWEKRSVISNHFTELVLDITEMEMPTIKSEAFHGDMRIWFIFQA